MERPTTQITFKEKKKILIEELKKASQLERDCIKIPWCRKGKPYGIKIYRYNYPIIIEFD